MAEVMALRLTRDRADRTSTHVTASQCRGVIEASKRAYAIGTPFNLHITLSWPFLGIPEEHAAAATGKFISLARDFLRIEGVVLPWIYVQEVGVELGSHSHILLHVPDHLITRFHAKWANWRRILRKKFGTPYRQMQGSAKKTRSIGLSNNCYRTTPKAHASNLNKVMSYLLKGAPSHVKIAMGLEGHSQNTGTVYGKRVGWWQVRQLGQDS